MIIPFMSIYLTLHFGAGKSGLMMIVAILSGVVASFYGGYYADIKGRKKYWQWGNSVNLPVFSAWPFAILHGLPHRC
jgi:MFS family permease